MIVLVTSISVYCVYSWCQQSSKEDIEIPENRGMNDCEPPRGCWEASQVPLQKNNCS